MKSFLSRYYDIKEVKALNDYLISLQSQIDYRKQTAKEILELKNLYISSSDKLEDFVPLSEKWKELKDKISAYDTAQIYLKQLKYNYEQVLYESYPNYFTINKHTYVGTAFYTRYDEDIYEHSEPTSYEKTYIFFTTMISGGEHIIIDNFKDYLVDYTRKESYDSKIDLIDDLIKENELLNKQIQVYEYEKKLKIDNVLKLFKLEDIEFWISGGWSSYQFIKYKNKEYKDKDVIELSNQYSEMKTKRYIKEDKYVEYPYYTPFVDFLELIESGEYSKENLENN